MTKISDLVLTFVANALWQVTLIAGVAACGAWLLRHAPAKYRHAVWVAALLLSFVLPFSSLQISGRERLGQVRTTHAIDAPAIASSASAARQFEGFSPTAKPSISLEVPLAFTVISLYVLLLLYRSSRLWQA